MSSYIKIASCKYRLRKISSYAKCYKMSMLLRKYAELAGGIGSASNTDTLPTRPSTQGFAGKYKSIPGASDYISSNVVPAIKHNPGLTRNVMSRAFQGMGDYISRNIIPALRNNNPELFNKYNPIQNNNTPTSTNGR